jgi:hypothetical protein
MFSLFYSVNKYGLTIRIFSNEIKKIQHVNLHARNKVEKFMFIKIR